MSTHEDALEIAFIFAESVSIANLDVFFDHRRLITQPLAPANPAL